MRCPACLPVLLLLASCSDDAAAIDAAPADVAAADASPAQSFQPMAVGASWTYTITDSTTGTVADKATTVEAYELVGDADHSGVMAFRLNTARLDGSDLIWQAQEGDRFVRYRDESYDASGVLTQDQWYVPSRLRLDVSAAHATTGATWTETFTQHTLDVTAGTPASSSLKSESWSVVSADESVTVPAGTFDHCLHVHRVASGSGTDKHYWFARGVGKVKETGGHTEELKAYSLP